MAWTTAISDLRTKLSDGPTDKLRAYKRVFGQIDGVNTVFKTFEFRRVSNFAGYAPPFGVYLNGILLGAGAVSSDTPENGFFILTSAPAAGDVVEATYYVQYFLDTELDTFLRLGYEWLGFGTVYTDCPSGLQPAVLHYALAESYAKLASRFSEHMSETYRLEDMPDVRRQALIAEWKEAGATARDMAHKLRNEYYTRQGQHLSPLFGTSIGRVRDVAPSR